MCSRLRPDIVLMDIRMPVLDGIEATRRIVRAQPNTRVLILTTFGLDGYVYDALHAGASGFMLKDAPPEEIAAAVHIISNGDALLAPAITRTVIEEFSRRQPAAPQPLPAGAGRADPARARSPRPTRPRPLQPRNLHAARHQRRNRQNPRRTHPPKTRPPRPRPNRHLRLRNRPHHSQQRQHTQHPNPAATTHTGRNTIRSLDSAGTRNIGCADGCFRSGDAPGARAGKRPPRTCSTVDRGGP